MTTRRPARRGLVARARSPLATFPFVEARRVVRSGLPGKGVWEAREEEWDKLRPARQRLILRRLREAFQEGERSLVGWPAIIAWLHEHGFRNREGGALNERTVRGWMKRLGCPILRGVRAFPGRTRSSPAWTSTYLLLAWATSLYRSGGFDKPRVEGPGVPKLPRGKSRYSSQDTSGSPLSPDKDTCARERLFEPAPARRRFIPPEHGAPPPIRRTVVR